jgi:hypothetical protein
MEASLKSDVINDIDYLFSDSITSLFDIHIREVNIIMLGEEKKERGGEGEREGGREGKREGEGKTGERKRNYVSLHKLNIRISTLVTLSCKNNLTHQTHYLYYLMKKQRSDIS